MRRTGRSVHPAFRPGQKRHTVAATCNCLNRPALGSADCFTGDTPGSRGVVGMISGPAWRMPWPTSGPNAGPAGRAGRGRSSRRSWPEGTRSPARPDRRRRPARQRGRAGPSALRSLQASRAGPATRWRCRFSPPCSCGRGDLAAAALGQRLRPAIRTRTGLMAGAAQGAGEPIAGRGRRRAAWRTLAGLHDTVGFAGRSGHRACLVRAAQPPTRAGRHRGLKQARAVARSPSRAAASVSERWRAT